MPEWGVSKGTDRRVCPVGRKPSAPRYRTHEGAGFLGVFQGEERELALGPDDRPGVPTHLAALEAFRKVVEGKTPGPRDVGRRAGRTRPGAAVADPDRGAGGLTAGPALRRGHTIE